MAGYGSVLGFCPRYLEYLHRLARESGDDGGGAFVPWRSSGRVTRDIAREVKEMK